MSEKHEGTLIREQIASMDLIKLKDYQSSLNKAKEYLIYILFNIEADNWLKVNGKEPGRPVPFENSDVLSLPLGADGYVVPTLPALEPGKWYDNSLSPIPFGPADFIDPETELEVFDKVSGLIEVPVKVKNVYWENIRKYRKWEALDESIDCFGMF